MWENQSWHSAVRAWPSEPKHVIVTVAVIQTPPRPLPLAPAAPRRASVAACLPLCRLCRAPRIGGCLPACPPRLPCSPCARQLCLPRCLLRCLLRLCGSPVRITQASCAAGSRRRQGCCRLCNKLSKLSRALPVLGCSRRRAAALHNAAGQKATRCAAHPLGRWHTCSTAGLRAKDTTEVGLLQVAVRQTANTELQKRTTCMCTSLKQWHTLSAGQVCRSHPGVR